MRASEEASLRKVHERQKLAKKKAAETAAASPKDARKKQRGARREIEDVEATITSIEERIATVTAVLDDPELYTRPGGVEEAKRHGAELERLKDELEAALARWTEVSEAVES